MNEGFTLLPAGPGKCPQCAIAHEPEQAHNAQSLFYQYHFYARRGRWPTWKDAVEHCPPHIREHWEKELKQAGAWTEPKSEVPDVLPTVHHTIGSVTTVPMRAPARSRKKCKGGSRAR